MGALTVLQQQQASGWDPEAVPWSYWSPEQIAAVTGPYTPVESVRESWMWIVRSLERFGINDRPTQMAAIGTIAIETASSWRPVREAYWLDDAYGYLWAEEYRRTHLPTSRYWPHYGRGFIQLTWRSNYKAAGEYFGIADLVAFPDQAMSPEIAADIFAWFFVTHGVEIAARAGDWAEVRRRVQGGYASLERLVRIVAQLEAFS